VLAGEQNFKDIVLNPLPWYEENGIHLHLGKTISRIDRTRRVVVTDDGTEARYDCLLIATGSTPFILPVPGKDLKGVITYRDICDTEIMIETARVRRRAVLIGGGLLGLEAANGLKLRGMDVAVVHLADTLLERQRDATAGTLLQQSLQERGLSFPMGKSTTGIVDNGSGEVGAVRFKDGEEIPADLVVMAAGIRPNSALAESAGLHCNRGIVVGNTLQTYDPRIYAVGECVSHRGVAYGLVAPLFEQARVCANHLALMGIGTYKGSVSSTRLKVTGIDLFSVSDFLGGDGTEEIVLSDPASGAYRKLVIKEGKLVGACLYGGPTEPGTSSCCARAASSANCAITSCSARPASATSARSSTTSSTGRHRTVAPPAASRSTTTWSRPGSWSRACCTACSTRSTLRHCARWSGPVAWSAS